MLIVAGTIRLNPKNRDAAIAAAKQAMVATSKEAGCISYTFSADLSEPGLFYVFEEWHSADALAAHFKTPHVAEFNRVLATLEIQRMDLKRYEVSSSSPLGG